MRNAELQCKVVRPSNLHGHPAFRIPHSEFRILTRSAPSPPPAPAAWSAPATRRAPAGTRRPAAPRANRSEEHTSELQSRLHLVCRLLLEKKKKQQTTQDITTT